MDDLIRATEKPKVEKISAFQLGDRVILSRNEVEAEVRSQVYTSFIQNNWGPGFEALDILEVARLLARYHTDLENLVKEAFRGVG